MKRSLSLVLCACGLSLPCAQARGESVCDTVAANAATETDVPLDLLRTIARVETGRNGEPWPWTLNIDGQGYWFDSQQEAADAVESALADGANQIDLGCFQLNLRWHGAAFADVATMLDPQQNASYAARFLSDLYRERGDWRMAAADYHSRTPEKGENYVAALEAAFLASGSGPLPAPEPQPVTPRQNRFPLLLAGEIGGFGSLVPVTLGVSPLIGAP